MEVAVAIGLRAIEMKADCCKIVSEDGCNSSELDHEGIALVLHISNTHAHNFSRFYGNQHMSATCCILVTSHTTELTNASERKPCGSVLLYICVYTRLKICVMHDISCCCRQCG